MRKRCHRRRPAGLHPLLLSAVPVADRDLLELRLREHLAVDALASGTGTADDLRVLRITAEVARVLTAAGYGADELGMLDRACTALAECSTSPAGVDAAGLALLQWLVGFADAQRTACSLSEFLQALAAVRRGSGRQ